MKHAFLLLFFSLAAWSQTYTTVAETIRYGAGAALFTGDVYIAAPEITYGGVYQQRGNPPTRIQVTSGVFSTQLLPNIGAEPQGTSYSVTYLSNTKVTWTQTWVVPYSASPVTIQSVVVRTVNPPNVPRLPIYQIALGGASAGQTLISNGQVFEPGFLPASSMTYSHGASGSVSRSVDGKLRDVISVKDFGALGNNSNDDGQEINAAIDAAEVAGGLVFFPAGIYRTTIPIVVTGHVILMGSGQEATYINNVSGSGNGVEFNQTGLGPWARSAGIRDLSIVAGGINNTTGDASNGIGLTVSNANHGFIFERVQVKNHTIGIDVVDSWNPAFSNWTVWFYRAVGVRVRNASATGGGQNFQHGLINNLSNTGTVDADATGMLVTATGGIYISDVEIARGVIGLSLKPGASESITYGFFDGLKVDTSVNHGIVLDTGAAGSSIYSVHFSDSWSAYNGYAGALPYAFAGQGLWIKQLGAGSVVDGVFFNSGRLRENGGNGAVIEGGSNIFITNSEIHTNSQSFDQGYSGVALDRTYSNVTISGNSIGNAISGQPNYQGYGIALNAFNGTADTVTITGNDLRGNAVGTIFRGTVGTSLVIANNAGVDDVVPTVASGSSVALPFNSVVKISGTTPLATLTGGWIGRKVDLVFTDAAPGGVTTGGNIGKALTAAQNQAITLMYDGSVWYPGGGLSAHAHAWSDVTSGKGYLDGWAAKPYPAGTVVGTTGAYELFDKTLTLPILTSYTVATLPTPSTGNPVAIVTDALTAGSCGPTGGGVELAYCRWSGTAWVSLGGAAGGITEINPGAMINVSPSGTTRTVSGDDTVIATFFSDTVAPTGACTVGKFAIDSAGVKWYPCVSGTWGAAVSLEGHTHSYQPLDSDLTAIAALACDDDEIPKKAGGVWTCAVDGGGGGAAGAAIWSGTIDLGSVAPGRTVSGTFTRAGALTSDAIVPAFVTGLEAGLRVIHAEVSAADTVKVWVINDHESDTINPAPHTFAVASMGLEITRQATAPATCTRGENYWSDTDDGKFYACTAPNTFTEIGTGSMTYPGAGVANSTGSAWGTSYTVGTSANNLVQLTAGAALPAVSAANLTSFPTFNQSTTGNAATASALAANGGNCSAGQWPTGVDAAGAAEGCVALAQLAGAAFTGAVSVTGSADAIQLYVKGNATQTNPIFVVAKSDNAVVIQANNDGSVQLGNGSGGMTLTEEAEPSSPASGFGVFYAASAASNFSYKNDAGVVSVAVVPATCTNQFMRALSAAGVITCAAIAIADTPLTTRGDLLLATGATPALGRLAKGTQYQVLTGGATEPAWGAVALDQATAVSGVLPKANIDTAVRKRSFGAVFDGGGSALTTRNSPPQTIPFACTVSAWNIMADAGTATFKVWKIATGTAIPTVSNSINTSGVSLASGTAVRSTTLTDFTSTAVTANDMFIISLTAVATATQVTVSVECDQ